MSRLAYKRYDYFVSEHKKSGLQPTRAAEHFNPMPAGCGGPPKWRLFRPNYPILFQYIKVVLTAKYCETSYTGTSYD